MTSGVMTVGGEIADAVRFGGVWKWTATGLSIIFS
jgi:hypothetical protein